MKLLNITQLCGLILLASLMGCSETFELFAPERDIWAVYGVLDTKSDSQFLRISKAFQYEGDAYEYAAENDLSETGLIVTLSGNGFTYEGIEINDIPKDTGIFLPNTSGYVFHTEGEERLTEGQVYSLTIRSSTNENLFLEAYTRTPPTPRVISPVTVTSRGVRCLPMLSLSDSLEIYFLTNTNQLSSQASQYEIRFTLDYEKNGLSQNYVFGPTRLFSKSVDCNSSGGEVLCYKFRDSVILGGIRSRLNDPAAFYSYDSFPRCGAIFDELPETFQLQVTAIDTFLSNYILANSPRYTNLNTYRREYTNISGTADAVGVFGSIAYHNVPIAMDPCSQLLTGLIPTIDPTVCD